MLTETLRGKEMESTVVDVLARRFAYLADAAEILEGVYLLERKSLTNCSGYQISFGRLRFKFYYYEDAEATVEAFWANEQICQHREHDVFTVFEREVVKKEITYALMFETGRLMRRLLEAEN